MRHNAPGTTLAIYALIFVLWCVLRLSLWFFAAVIVAGGLINLWSRRWQLLAMIRAARRPDDPMPDWMEDRDG